MKKVKEKYKVVVPLKGIFKKFDPFKEAAASKNEKQESENKLF